MGKLASIKALSEIVELFHGTNASKLDEIIANGLKSPVPEPSSRGNVFASPRSDVGTGYAAMGGERDFVKNGAKSLSDEERALLRLEIPKDWYRNNVVREKLDNSVPEVSFNSDIPPEFIKDSVIGRKEALNKYPPNFNHNKNTLKSLAALAGVGGLSMFQSEDADAMLVGPNSVKVSQEIFKKAKKLFDEGYDSREVWDILKDEEGVGVLLGADDHIKMEIPDTAGPNGINNSLAQQSRLGPRGESEPILLEDMWVTPPPALEHYPELKKLEVYDVNEADRRTDAGALDGSEIPKYMLVNKDRHSGDTLKTMLHEMQHWIQAKEGWASGGSPELFLENIDIRRKIEDVIKQTEASWDTKLAEYNRINELIGSGTETNPLKLNRLENERHNLRTELLQLKKRLVDDYKNRRYYDPEANYLKMLGETDARITQNSVIDGYDDYFYDRSSQTYKGQPVMDHDDLFVSSNDSPVKNSYFHHKKPDKPMLDYNMSGQGGSNKYSGQHFKNIGNKIDNFLTGPVRLGLGGIAHLTDPESNKAIKWMNQDPWDSAAELETDINKYDAGKWNPQKERAANALKWGIRFL